MGGEKRKYDILIRLYFLCEEICNSFIELKGVGKGNRYMAQNVRA